MAQAGRGALSPRLRPSWSYYACVYRGDREFGHAHYFLSARAALAEGYCCSLKSCSQFWGLPLPTRHRSSQQIQDQQSEHKVRHLYAAFRDLLCLHFSARGYFLILTLFSGLFVNIIFSTLQMSYQKPDQKRVQTLRDIANKMRIHSVNMTQASNSGWAHHW